MAQHLCLIQDLKDLHINFYSHLKPSYSLLQLCGRQANLSAVLRRSCKRHELLPTVGIPALDSFKLLQQADRHVARLGERILLAWTDTRPTVEGKILPTRAQGLPPLRPEFLRIGPVKVLASVHHIDVV